MVGFSFSKASEANAEQSTVDFVDFFFDCFHVFVFASDFQVENAAAFMQHKLKIWTLSWIALRFDFFHVLVAFFVSDELRIHVILVDSEETFLCAELEELLNVTGMNCEDVNRNFCLLTELVNEIALDKNFVADRINSRCDPIFVSAKAEHF